MTLKDKNKDMQVSERPFLGRTFSSPHASSKRGTDYIQLRFEDRDRFYKIHLPIGYDKSKPAALVLNFHGGSGSPDDQQIQSNMDSVADRHGFIVVYPAGTGKTKDKNLFFNAGDVFGYAKANNINDIGFVEYMIGDLLNRFSIDRKKIFTTGFSNGAKFCYLLAARLSHIIAAIGPVSGTFAMPLSEYKPKRCVSIIHFHGTLDSINPYQGGLGLPLLRLWSGTKKINNTPAKKIIDHCLDLYECQKNDSETFRRGNALCQTCGTGKEGSEVRLWTLTGSGHTWPGGQRVLPKFLVGDISRDINASELIWEFFNAHPMR